MRLLRLAFAAVALAASSSCAGDSGLGPDDAGVSFLVTFLVPSGGTYTATLNNTTYTATGGFPLTLPPGTYEISGSFTGGVFGLGFGTTTGAGVESGSVRNLAGGDASVGSCGVNYVSLTNTAMQQFRVQFRVTTNTGSVCQQPG